jgi:hypothetical protein
VSVEPSEALSLQPGSQVAIDLTFSHEIGPAKGGQELEGRTDCASQKPRTFVCEHAVFMYARTQGTEAVKTPEVLPATIDRMAERVVRFTFAAGDMQRGKRYLLHIQQDFFRSVDGDEADVAAHRGAHQYEVARSQCDCNGKGDCDVEGRCACKAGYMGAHCQVCADGYASREVCAQNPQPVQDFGTPVPPSCIVSMYIRMYVCMYTCASPFYTYKFYPIALRSQAPHVIMHVNPYAEQNLCACGVPTRALVLSKM